MRRKLSLTRDTGAGFESFEVRSLRRHDAPRRACRFDAKVRASRLVAGPYGALAADERRGARVEALRPRQAVQRQRPRAVA